MKKKREAENLSQVLALNEMIVDKPQTLAAPYRRYVGQGPLFEIISQEQRSQFVFVFTDLIIITNTNLFKDYWKKEQTSQRT